MSEETRQLLIVVAAIVAVFGGFTACVALTNRADHIGECVKAGQGADACARAFSWSAEATTRGVDAPAFPEGR